VHTTADIHGMGHFGPIFAPQPIGTVPVINVRWWQHHETKLPMAKMSVNILYTLYTVYYTVSCLNGLT
jgi:hypothetical protein